MNIIDYAISHARVFFGILIFIIAAGSSSYISIPKEAAPDVNIPIIYVSLSQKGISANDSERLLVKHCATLFFKTFLVCTYCFWVFLV